MRGPWHTLQIGLLLQGSGARWRGTAEYISPVSPQQQLVTWRCAVGPLLTLWLPPAGPVSLRLAGSASWVGQRQVPDGSDQAIHTTAEQLDGDADFVLRLRGPLHVVVGWRGRSGADTAEQQLRLGVAVGPR